MLCGLAMIHCRHVIDWTVTTETADASVHMRRVIVINVIDRAMDPHPIDRLPAIPALPHRLKFRIVFLHLRMAIHAGLRVWHIRLRCHLHKAVTIPAIHSELRDVNIVRKRHWLDRLVADFRVFWRRVIPRRCGQSADDHNAADQELERQPIRPAWKKICHNYESATAATDVGATSATADSSFGELPTKRN